MKSGTYQISKVQIFSAAAVVLLAQSAPSQSSAASTNLPTAATPASDASAPAAGQSGATALPAAPTAVSQTASQPVTAAPSTTPAAGTSGASASGSQDLLAAFNSALQSLGLNQQQIKAFDQVATFINSLSPEIFAKLVSQLQAVTQQISNGLQSATATSGNSAAAPSSETASNAASPAAAQTGTASPATDAGSITSASQPNGTYQFEEISIRLSGMDLQGSTGTTDASHKSSGASFDLASFNLSIQDVKVTSGDAGNSLAAASST